MPSADGSLIDVPNADGNLPSISNMYGSLTDVPSTDVSLPNGKKDLFETPSRSMDRSQTPVCEHKSSGFSASVDEDQGQLSSRRSDGADRRPPPLDFVQSFASNDELVSSEIQPGSPAAGVTSSSVRGVAQIRLKHARTKLATLQRRLDRFIEEAAKSGPLRPKLPGAAEDPGSPLNFRSVQRNHIVPDGSVNSSDGGCPTAAQSPLGSMKALHCPPMLVRPVPPDLGRRDLLASAVNTHTPRRLPASPSNQQSPPVIEGQPLRPAAVLVGRLAQRLHLLAEQDQQPPPPPPPRVDGITASPLSDGAPPPPFRPERVRPRVLHINPSVASSGALSAATGSLRLPPSHATVHESNQDNTLQQPSNSVKDSAFLDLQI
jgi:hypothetical protein